MESELVVTAAVLRHSDGRVMLARRAPGRAEAGLWEFPGGKVEPGEAPEASLGRELHEELGLDVRVGRLLTSCAGRTGSGRALRLLAYEVELELPAPPWATGALPVEGGFPDHDAVAWAPVAGLGAFPMPAVDDCVVRALQEGAGAPETT